ncbi:uncharacterized protein LOC107655876 [Sinocyclocheilus anshuiensis]|uniref:uncharacterized protein LOC107655876 n=1 Tax=Sinocyclocheilus anshuiensis TaxID=1608454 RepID=UPI0007B90E67|nr:PREDICTED: uncharacterized protein LOC107655876 [Sinocyclocheilus anshuiensis]
MERSSVHTPASEALYLLWFRSFRPAINLLHLLSSRPASSTSSPKISQSFSPAFAGFFQALSSPSVSAIWVPASTSFTRAVNSALALQSHGVTLALKFSISALGSSSIGSISISWPPGVISLTVPPPWLLPPSTPPWASFLPRLWSTSGSSCSWLLPPSAPPWSHHPSSPLVSWPLQTLCPSPELLPSSSDILFTVRDRAFREGELLLRLWTCCFFLFLLSCPV